MEKDVFFYFKNGVEQKLERVFINDKEMALSFDESADTHKITNLKPRKNSITLIFKDRMKFSIPLPGGEWDKIIINQAKESKIYNGVLLGIGLVGILSFILDILVFKNEAVRTTAVTGFMIWSYYILKNNKHSVIFR